MGTNTTIEWTDHTFNILIGCTKVSDGCKNCYAATRSHRLKDAVWGEKGTRKTLGAKYWAQPFKWNRDAEREGRRHRVFCSSLADVFEDHPVVTTEREKLWPMVRLTPHLEWQLLTKRPERIVRCLPNDWGVSYANVWLGTTIENNDYVDRADWLRAIPACIRFISYEPALGPLTDLDLTGIDWVIIGGESGHGARSMKPEWVLPFIAECSRAGAKVFFKQLGSVLRKQLGLKDAKGGDHDEFPPEFRIREFPEPKLCNTQTLR